MRPGGLDLADPAEATLTGTVARATFLGDRLRVEIAGAADSPLVVDAAPDAVAVPGTRVGLRLREGGLIVAPRAEETP